MYTYRIYKCDKNKMNIIIIIITIYENVSGQKFAMLEMKSVFSKILHNFNLEPVDLLENVLFRPDLVLRPHNPIRTRFIRRNKKWLTHV